MKKRYFSKKEKGINDLLIVDQISKWSGLKTRNIIEMISTNKLFFIVLVVISIMASCTYLDYSEQDMYAKDQVFAWQDRTKAVLSNIYSYLPKDFSSVGGAVRSSACDDAIHGLDVSDINRFNDGSWSSILTLDNVWSRMYTGIREANQFLATAPGQTFPYMQYNAGYSQTMLEYVVYPYEARFLRAYFYFELIKRYGSVPLITTVLTSDQINSVTPSSYEDIVTFITTECDSAIAKLPVTYNSANFVNKETGRATKGAAMALKTRTLLYAASPLHNPANDQAKWIAAATAAKSLIDQLGANYSPLAAYTTVWNNLSSIELILETRQADDRAFESANTAVGFIGGNPGTCPTQNLVDAYEMKTTGLGITESGSGYDPSNPYSTTGASARDPRLAMTILYNGSVWKSPQTVQTWYGGLNGSPTPNATKTGYYIKKYMVESINLNPAQTLGTARHVWVNFRYSEVLLNYVEAMNEAYGPDAAGPAPLNNLTARAAVNIVRARTGVAMPVFPLGMTQSAFRDKLRNERRVELAFEDHRFWDLRRWKIGPTTTTIRGMNLTKDPVTSVITYIPTTVQTRYWNDKMYLYPIPQTELFINKNLVQNPGW